LLARGVGLRVKDGIAHGTFPVLWEAGDRFPIDEGREREVVSLPTTENGFDEKVECLCKKPGRG